jgi:acyl-CoA synthetase (AMP-forming)/AMP-acid ligase II
MSKVATKESLTTAFENTVLKYPNKTAIFDRSGSYSYSEFQQRINIMAHYLTQIHGLNTQDRVLIYLPNTLFTVETIYACMKAGLVFSVINTQTKNFHLEYIIQDSGAVLFLTDEERKNNLTETITEHIKIVSVEEVQSKLANLKSEEVLQEYPSAQPDDLSCLIYTSGSTGFPKAIMCKPETMLFAADAIQQMLAYQSTDTVMVVLPLSFDYGLYQVFLAFGCGATVALGDEDLAGPLILKKLIEWEITCLPLVPGIMESVLRMLKRNSKVLPPLRLITNTGAHLPLSNIEAFKVFFPECQVFVMYGLTECKRVAILPHEEFDSKKGSVGKPLPGTKCYIVDKDDQVLMPGEKGELVVSGKHVMSGYLNKEELTSKRFREFKGERALFTGDFCSMDREGYIYFHGRNDDVFKRKGFRVSSLEIEKAAITMPKVANASLVVEQNGKKLTLFVETENYTPQEIKACLFEKIEAHKIPDTILIIGEIPKNPNGKNDKSALTKRYLS